MPGLGLQFTLGSKTQARIKSDLCNTCHVTDMPPPWHCPFLSAQEESVLLKLFYWNSFYLRSTSMAVVSLTSSHWKERQRSWSAGAWLTHCCPREDPEQAPTLPTQFSSESSDFVFCRHRFFSSFFLKIISKTIYSFFHTNTVFFRISLLPLHIALPLPVAHKSFLLSIAFQYNSLKLIIQWRGLHFFFFNTGHFNNDLK